MAFSSLSRFPFLRTCRSFPASQLRHCVNLRVFWTSPFLIQVRRYLFTHYTPETLLNHVFEDLRKPKAPNMPKAINSLESVLSLLAHSHHPSLWTWHTCLRRWTTWHYLPLKCPHKILLALIKPGKHSKVVGALKYLDVCTSYSMSIAWSLNCNGSYLCVGFLGSSTLDSLSTTPKSFYLSHRSSLPSVSDTLDKSHITLGKPLLSVTLAKNTRQTFYWQKVLWRLLFLDKYQSTHQPLSLPYSSVITLLFFTIFWIKFTCFMNGEIWTCSLSLVHNLLYHHTTTPIVSILHFHSSCIITNRE
jgi:hypothetical protein